MSTTRFNGRGTLLERFEEKVERTEDCWLWLGSKVMGYGVLGLNYKLVYAHRVSYEEYVGPIPTDYEVDHLCRVRACVNPAHLEAVTGTVNRQRQAAARKVARA